MNHLLRLAGWYADTLLKSWFPLEKESSLEDLECSDVLERLVCVVEDVRNILYNPKGFGVQDDGPTGTLRDGLVTDIDCAHPFGYDHPCEKCGHPGGNFTVSSVVSEAAAETPREAPSASPGGQVSSARLNLMFNAAQGLRELAGSGVSPNPPTWWDGMADELLAWMTELEQAQKK